MCFQKGVVKSLPEQNVPVPMYLLMIVPQYLECVRELSNEYHPMQEVYNTYQDIVHPTSFAKLISIDLFSLETMRDSDYPQLCDRDMRA